MSTPTGTPLDPSSPPANRIGVVLPNGVPGCTGATVLEWARRADEGPFSALGVADRYVYVNHECMMTAAAAAAVTRRVRITTQAVLPPLRPVPLFAKQAATLVQLAPGRTTLGVAIGNRDDDYTAAGVPKSRRGRLLDAHLDQLAAMRDLGGEEQCVGPELGACEILVGGASAPALARMVRHGDGLISGGVRPGIFAFEAYAAHQAWQGAGRPGRPRLVAGTWYASSTAENDLAEARLDSYLKAGGPPPPVRSAIARGREGIEETFRAYREQGADEVLFFPLLDDLAELDWLADVVRGLPPVGRGEPRPDFQAMGSAS